MEPPPKSYAEIMAEEKENLHRPRGSIIDIQELATELKENPVRAKLRIVMSSSRFDSFMGVVIMANICVMCAQSNASAPCADTNDQSECIDTALRAINISFQILYTIEASCRLFLDRLDFFKNKWNILDVTIVVLGWFDIIMDFCAMSLPGPGVSLLRIFRVGRLLRIVRILSFFPELYMMIRGFGGAMMAMFWGMILILGLLVIWSIIGVELLYPEALKVTWPDSSCPDSFSSVQRCLLYFFASVFAGDAWGTCVVPIVVAQPWTFLVFSAALISIQLGFTNLVLAVIVEKATGAQMADAETQHKEQIEKHKEKTRLLKESLSEIDEDKSGSLDVGELRRGYAENEDLAALLGEVDVGEEDLVKMSELLANDQGVARIDEFVDSLERCQSDLPRQILMMNLTINNIKRSVDSMRGSSSGHQAKQTKELPKTELPLKYVEPETKDMEVGQATVQVLQELQAERERLNKSSQDWQSNLDRLLSDLVQGSQTYRQEQADFMQKQLAAVNALAAQLGDSTGGAAADGPTQDAPAPGTEPEQKAAGKKPKKKGDKKSVVA